MLLLPVVAYLTLAASGIGWDQWGGLQLNLFLTLAGVVFAFPLGILLALGRRSSLPGGQRAFRWHISNSSRGVPLITLLLLGVFALGFFLPLELRPSGVTRVLVAITLFEAAYIAEVVRGGFQAVPPGQTEAAASLGLSAFQTTRSIVMPQALRATIPAMVGQFISLFKDTTLVAVVGFPDVLAASGFANTQPAFNAQGLARITLPFVALVFWAGCYTMSQGGQEARAAIGDRRAMTIEPATPSRREPMIVMEHVDKFFGTLPGVEGHQPGGRPERSRRRHRAFRLGQEHA